MSDTNQVKLLSPRVIGIGLLIGLLLNISGWLGNNLLLRDMWAQITWSGLDIGWRDSPIRHFFSLIPDFIYGMAIAILCVITPEKSTKGYFKIGVFVSVVGGITTYFAIANSGFIPWNLAYASFFLVLITKVPLSLLAGRLVNKN